MSDSDEIKTAKHDVIVFLTIVVLISFFVAIQFKLSRVERENDLLRHYVEKLKDEKTWIWEHAVTTQIKYGEPRIEFDRIIVPVIGLSSNNETLFVANASLPFETEDCILVIHDGSLHGYATGEIEQLKRKIDSLKADLEFYKQYFQKYMDTQMGLLPLISNQTASMALWNISMQLTLSDIRYEQPLFGSNRTIQVRIDHYSFNKTYGYCRVEAQNFTWINHASFPILKLNMLHGSQACIEWKLISENETECVVQQSLRLENVTFMDGTTFSNLDLTLNHVIHKCEGDI